MNSANLEFDNAAEFLAFFDDELNSLKYTMYPWQVQLLSDATSVDYQDTDPFKASVVAVNGSGKDRMIISPLAVFFLCCHRRATVVITSASAKQIDQQTKPYVRNLGLEVNRKMGREYLQIFDRKIICPETESVCYLFATDEGQKAEGYHPMDPVRKLVLIVNEAKSVDEEIFKALYRCTGFTHRIDISSPGKASGHFYKMHTLERWKNYKVTAFDCPHLGRRFADDIAAEYGEDSPLYDSMVNANFGSEEARVVISLEQYNRCMSAATEWKQGEIVAGFDPSKGGDESVLAIRNGNKLIQLLTMRTRETSELISQVETWMLKYKVQKIIGDAGGLGAPVLDELKRRGWEKVIYVINNGKPFDERAYYDRGTETWFNLAHLIEDRIPILDKDEKLKLQLTDRKCVNVDGQRMKLEPKQKLPKSPDRADAVVLCYSDYSHKKYGTTFTPRKNVEVQKERFPQLHKMIRRDSKPSDEILHNRRVSMLQFEIEELNAKLRSHN